MHVTDRTATLGSIVAGQPDAAELFERLGLDYCCGGGATLESACDARGLDVEAVAMMLEGLHAEPVPPDAPPRLAARSITALCEHIVVRRHGPLRVDLQRIGALLDTVVRVHGPDHPELIALRDRFAATRRDLETHICREEEVLFPACCALEREVPTALDESLLAGITADHDETGAALHELRRLGGDYDVEAALCATHRLLLQALTAFERTLHQHVHEENNVLFPKVRRRLIAA